ncbi:MAG TPA: GMC family oxidoreductase [Candidatus Eisenbacteria bacterium]|nr:GMC family oxidoreductase [Candidatus Eisenbacteria bacterium]
MIVDARSVPENDTVAFDVCVAGAGVAGISLAAEFIGKGFEVCLLESGDLKHRPEIQSLAAGENAGYPYFPLDTARARVFGGTSNFWDIDIGDGCTTAARLRPLDAIDFEARDWVPHSGWPIAKTDLDPFYARAQALLEVEPSSYEVSDWTDGASAPLPFAADRVQTIIYKFVPGERFFNDLRHEIIKADNILSFLFANVVEIETDEHARSVKRLRVRCLEGNGFWIAAKIFVLAMGGIETPRLLLLSNKIQTNGLANQNDLVGRFFMEHLHFWSGVYIPRGCAARDANLYREVRRVNQVPVIGKVALSERVLRSEKLLNQNVQLIPADLEPWDTYPGIRSEGVLAVKAIGAALRRRRLPDDLPTHLKRVFSGIDDVAEAGYQKLARVIGRAFNGTKKVQAFLLAHMTEQVPNPESRVTLSDSLDSLGQPRVRLDWRLSEIDLLSPIRTQEILDAELRRAGLGYLRIEMRDTALPPTIQGGYHHMGTTRMHEDPKKGVVDANCRVHGISNLFIAGPSVFPTGGYANPTLTTVALALRLADHVKSIMQ